MKRTDPHRPGAIVPAHYEPVLGYNCATSQDGWPVPSFGVVCTRFDAKLKAEVSTECPDGCMRSTACASKTVHAAGKQVFGSPGKCGSCGAWFVYGELWMHSPTGDLVHLGHDCAQKYELMMDRSAAELANNRARAAIATQIRKAEKAEDRAAFLAAHPGLAEAFEVGDAQSATRGAQIIADIAARFVEFCSLSEKQIALVLKLAHEIRNPKPPEEQERHATAPTGKGVEFEGTIVSAKLRMSEQWGNSWKVTIKVTNDDGAVWLAWGTAPKSLMDAAVAIAEHAERVNRTLPAAERAIARDRGERIVEALRGMRVEVKATLERPSQRDASECETDGARKLIEQRNSETHFVMMQRPSIYPTCWSHPIKSAKRIKAETAFAKLVSDERIAMTAIGGSHYGHYVVPAEDCVASLAARGITLDGMIAESLAPKTRAPRKATIRVVADDAQASAGSRFSEATVLQVGEAFALAMAGL